MFERSMKMALLLTGVALLAGCTSQPEFTPKGQTTIPVYTGDSRAKATVKLLNEVIVELPPATIPGMVWTLVLNDERFLRTLHPVETSRDGSAKARFMAIRDGRRLVRFFALPPNSREATPSQTYEIQITIE